MRRTVIGSALQVAGTLCAWFGVYLLFGVAVMLLVAGVVVVAAGVLYEAGRV